MFKFRTLICILLLFAATNQSFSQLNNIISYQGILTDLSGNVTPDGDYNLIFYIYDVELGGSPMWTSAKTVSIELGVFYTLLGENVPLNLPFNKHYWLAISVNGNPEMAPRIKLVSSPYAIYSKTSGISQGLTVDATGAVLSLNGLQGHFSLQGAGATTVSISGNDLIITSQHT